MILKDPLKFEAVLQDGVSVEDGRVARDRAGKGRRAEAALEGGVQEGEGARRGE